jgi:hypothetical protein
VQVTNADEELSSSPSDMDQRSPPKLLSCSPHARLGTFASPGDGAILDFSTAAALVSPGATPVLYSSAVHVGCSPTDGSGEIGEEEAVSHAHVQQRAGDHAKTSADDTLRSAQLSSQLQLRCDPESSPVWNQQHQQPTVPAEPASPASPAHHTRASPVQSAVCLSEHPPGIRSSVDDVHEGDAGTGPGCVGVTGGSCDQGHCSPSRTPPSGATAVSPLHFTPFH